MVHVIYVYVHVIHAYIYICAAYIVTIMYMFNLHAKHPTMKKLFVACFQATSINYEKETYIYIHIAHIYKISRSLINQVTTSQSIKSLQN